MRARFDLRSAPLEGGTVLLEASAGTGKTYAVVGLLLRLLLERRIERLDQALVVTFTVAATEELKNRLRAALIRTLRATRERDADPFFHAMAELPEAARLVRAALDDFDQVSIATIHGFCKRLLDESAFETREPFTLDFVADPLPYLRSAAADALRSVYTENASIAGALLHLSRIDPRSLVRIYALWQRYPHIELQPTEPDLQAHFPAIQTALDQAAAAIDDDACAVIERFDWLAGRSPAPVASRFSTTRVRERITENPVLALPELCTFARTQLEKTLKRRGRPPLTHPFFAACDAVLAATDTAKEHLRSALLQRMHKRLAVDKRQDHVVAFDDLLERSYAALHDPDRRGALLAAIGARYRTALIDEFQDTDRLQYDIFATCFADRPLFLIGDPKQSIYGFRGADLRAYVEAQRDASASYTLGTNHRSSRGLVEAVQRTCGGAGAFVDPAIELPAVEARADAGALLIGGEDLPPLQWRFVTKDGLDVRNGFLHKTDTEERIAADVAAEIARLLQASLSCDGRPLAPRDIAVLCRTNAQSTMVQEHLRSAGIVSAIGKAGDVFATDELVELDRLLTAILQPRNLQACRGAMSTRIYGHSATTLAALGDDDDAFDRELLRFERWRRTWMRRGFFAMKEQLLEDLGVEARILPIRGGERRLTNFQQLCELLHRAEHDNRLSPEGLHEWLQHERLHHEELDYQLRELRLESDDDAVQILTVHGSKGLQYEVVFCPFLWEAREARGEAIVPSEATRELVFDLWKDHPKKHTAELDRLAEDVRLVYVALTRARRRCHVHIGPIAGVHRSALLWLLAPVDPKSRVDKAERREGQWFADWTERMRKAPDQLTALVDRLVEANGAIMSRIDVPAAPLPRPVTIAAPAGRGKPRRARREPRTRGLFSFSSLVADHVHEPTGRDIADPPAPEIAAETPTGIFAFARGPAAGNCLHAILEHLDWSALGDDNLASRIRSTLADCGLLDSNAHRNEIDPVATVVDNIRDLATAEVFAGGPTIGDLCRGTGIPEWQFTLPTVDSPMPQLTEHFERADSKVAQRYATRLSELPPRQLYGFLTGFVDHVAVHDDRFWIIDWKSNHLGDRASEYGPEALGDAMHGHDYVLQYHLYSLALHRQLQRRLPDYDYDRHFGGVSYAFLRGAVPATASGMFFDRPPRALIEAMDAWAGGCGQEART